jgi:Cyclic GMP-AMP synthase DncV-like, nucleotidyltransferase domain/Adenylyl/Guanylyl and SMODS C-terminal sensor domain
MGITDFLFFSSDSTDQTLHRRITPSDEQFEEQQTRWNSLADYLRPLLKEKTGYNIRTWLQGSYKFGTQIRPSRKGDEFDIDMGVYLEWEGKPADGRFTPPQVKEIVQASLKEFSEDGVIEVVSPPKERCSRIRFEGDFHIDVPAYHLDPVADLRTLATENRWEDSDPQQLYYWFQELFDEHDRARVRHLVRYVKCWASLKFRDVTHRPSSTLLTVLVAEAFLELPDDERLSDDEALASVLDSIIQRLEQDLKVKNPINEQEILSARMSQEDSDNFLEQLREFRRISLQALKTASVSEAAAVWGEAFEQFFPIPEEEQLAKALSQGRIGEAVSINAALPATVVPDVRVRAISRVNRNFQYNGVNKLGPIPKDCDIYFEVTNRNAIPPDATIEWMVRNAGGEAESVNDLGHRAGTGWTAKESSAYVGTHFMDCIVKRGKRISGMRRVPVAIENRSVPRR